MWSMSVQYIGKVHDTPIVFRYHKDFLYLINILNIVEALSSLNPPINDRAQKPGPVAVAVTRYGRISFARNFGFSYQPTPFLRASGEVPFTTPPINLQSRHLKNAAGKILPNRQIFLYIFLRITTSSFSSVYDGFFSVCSLDIFSLLIVTSPLQLILFIY